VDLERALHWEWAGGKYTPLAACAVAYLLIAATVWTRGPAQRCLLVLDAVFFLTAAVVAFRSAPFELPRLTVTAAITAIGLVVAGGVVLAGWRLGTLHKLFGKPLPWYHAAAYLLWAMIQQWIQQGFFFVRLEKFLSRHGACLAAGALFGLVHLPNPVLTPVTFLGGWIMSEIFQRYRSVVPLGIVHGLVGLAIALAVPDQINHHMRVGLGYLEWGG
jgi:hypothetical protein